ncbi:DUF2550 domain-containing protein [Streptomyces peucetius]|uniref:DUF2550 domain-containing protein n=1 Tax=Streptomyces peucetius TaxID=1950 RepID=A0ABY6IF82_STRPE|nr:DUF2550 domain-containing protein [Streptomyces peucetius]UYQ65683.1 DUF2550 domain-containing protein [Streptomyces peucetius]
MVELVLLGALASLIGWLVHRKQRQRSSGVAAGDEAGIGCMLKGGPAGARWRPGRLFVASGPLTWKASWGGRTVALPAGLRRTGLRPPSTREALGLNPRSRIVECEAGDEVILIAVMPQELDPVVKAVDSA